MRPTRMVALVAAMPALVLGVQAASANPAGTYEVTITNLTGGQPFTPALAATHKGNDGFFQVGGPASLGIQEIAENGNLAPMINRVEGDRDFLTHVVKEGETGVPPVMPGETVSFDIVADPPHSFLSWASMLICTNDGFTGVNKLKLPDTVGQSVTVETQAYDAGTELNTELFADLVPPCGPLTGQDSMGQGTGMTNPALAEGGVIHHHAGITGVGDLVPEIHDWDNPVAVITVERIG
jgi:hypothetical protein